MNKILKTYNEYNEYLTEKKKEKKVETETSLAPCVQFDDELENSPSKTKEKRKIKS